MLSKTLIVIISDGVKKLDPSIQEAFKKFNLFDLDLINRQYSDTDKQNKKDITFFFQGELAYYPKENDFNERENSIESHNILKVVFGVKTENKRKLHSHMLLLMVCCKDIKPEYVIVSFN